MNSTKPSIVHQEVISLLAPPDVVRQFIMTPERILDYYPDGIDCGEIESGSSLYCRGKSGVSLLEFMNDQGSESKVVVKVTTAMKVAAPYTEQRIKADPFFTMMEDWEIEPEGSGSRLTKTWREVMKFKLKLLPLNSIIKKSAKKESLVLRNAWDRAYEVEAKSKS